MESDGQASDENSQLRPEDVALIEQALIVIRRDHARRHMQQRAEWASEHGGDGASGSASAPGSASGSSPWQGPGGWTGQGPWPGPGPWPISHHHGGGPRGPGPRFGGAGHEHRGRHDGSLGRAARFRMLDALEAAEREGRALTISMIGEAIGVDQPRASRLVQEASDAGLVRRTADPSDARRSIIELTTAGRAQIADVRTARRSAVEDALAGFTPEEAHTFAQLFIKFVGAWPRE
jgi:DNA-binding MarR family transcriptional regulator